MSETPETPEGTSEGAPEGASAEPSPEAKRRVKLIAGGAVAFIVAALIAVAILFSSAKSGSECDPWLKAKSDYLKQIPPIQQETASDAINFDGKVVVGGQTFIRPDSCK